ncbi:MAG: (E)-4-hydroxy-3-methylbut-2-enyl-diphosphate synthase [Actinomycetota bacterium]|nr:(E)-4-hydroxy-3-methylbut-2-enyl-diphosphate synthase [Actinomycetota bacterium]
MVGRVPVGGDAPISIQSMTTTTTADVDGTLAQIYALAAAGCDIVRCTCNEEEAAAAPWDANRTATGHGTAAQRERPRDTSGSGADEVANRNAPGNGAEAQRERPQRHVKVWCADTSAGNPGRRLTA